MRLNKMFARKRKLIMSCIITIFTLFFMKSLSVYAQTDKVEMACKYYEFEKDSKYEISTSYSKSVLSHGSNNGLFTIVGDAKSISNINGFNAYEVQDGNVQFFYELKSAYTTQNVKEWHLINDNSKHVDGLKLDDDIRSGAVIVQTSLTGTDWITETVYTDIRDEKTMFQEEIYISKDIQQVNGCYYRVIVVYEVNKENEVDKGITNWSGVEQEYKKCAEVYEFYLIDSCENISEATQPTDEPRKEMGSKINTGKDNGYSGSEVIDNKDPHFGWDIGTFFVNGYTRETTDLQGKPVFLKNVGDRVTLWFNLKQDINCLNGNDKLTINEDENGYDQYFEIGATNFKRGTLIIRYTDHEGAKHNPIIYTDYLAANARTGANTKVELFEEGDYEVALNYEIKDSSGVNICTNYRISFEFSIRNGNCMIFPFDVITGAELSDNAITENGFRLDMAKSRYLTIDVKKEVLKLNNGYYMTDVRFNRPAEDGDMYSDEGIYTFTVKNMYTDSEPTTKIIYVGSDPMIKAMASGYTIEEINDLLAQGAEIQGDGSFVMPIAEDKQDTIVESQLSSEEAVTTQSDKVIVSEEAVKNLTDENVMQKENERSFSGFVLFGVVGTVAILVVVLLIIKRRGKMIKETVVKGADE